MCWGVPDFAYEYVDGNLGIGQHGASGVSGIAESRHEGLEHQLRGRHAPLQMIVKTLMPFWESVAWAAVA